jgi:hypothetical protein
VHSAITFSPFEALYGLNPFTPANLLTNNPTYALFASIAKIHDIHALISKQLKIADVYQATYYNRRTKPLEFAENDFVWLFTADLSLRNQPCTKLRQRFIGPYAVSAKFRHMPTASASPSPCNTIMFSAFPVRNHVTVLSVLALETLNTQCVSTSIPLPSVYVQGSYLSS